MKQLIEIQNIIDAQRDEIETLKDRLILAQSEALSAIQQNEPKPEPRDIGHENVVSFVTRKSGELQVSPGIVWGLIMDLIAKNPNHFGTDADACPDPIPEPGHDSEPFEFRVGDIVRYNRDGDLYEIESTDLLGMNGHQRIFLKGCKLGWFIHDELEFISRP
jgi:hypothetical protein